MTDQESFISHLIELRQRLVRAVGAVLALFVLLFIWPGSGYIYDILAAPLMSATARRQPRDILLVPNLSPPRAPPGPSCR